MGTRLKKLRRKIQSGEINLKSGVYPKGLSARQKRKATNLAWAVAVEKSRQDMASGGVSTS